MCFRCKYVDKYVDNQNSDNDNATGSSKNRQILQEKVKWVMHAKSNYIKYWTELNLLIRIGQIKTITKRMSLFNFSALYVHVFSNILFCKIVRCNGGKEPSTFMSCVTLRLVNRDWFSNVFLQTLQTMTFKCLDAICPDRILVDLNVALHVSHFMDFPHVNRWSVWRFF